MRACCYLMMLLQHFFIFDENENFSRRNFDEVSKFIFTSTDSFQRCTSYASFEIMNIKTMLVDTELITLSFLLIQKSRKSFVVEL